MEEDKKKSIDMKIIKKIGKKGWIIFGLSIVAIATIALLASRGAFEKGYEWPTDGAVKMLPVPDGKVTYVYSSDDYVDAIVRISSENKCNEYIQACKELGFTKNVDYSASNGTYDLTANNREGWEVWVYNDGNKMYIYLNTSDNLDEEELDDVEMDEEESIEENDESSEASPGVTASFKETMDDYEEFMDDYIAFMKKYNKSSDPSSMLTDYSKMLTKYSEFAEKINAINTNSLSPADYAYYVEVTARVAGKLAKASL